MPALWTIKSRKRRNQFTGHSAMLIDDQPEISMVLPKGRAMATRIYGT
ncbi:calcium-binding protein, partial [Sinorhizobium meliloti]